MIIDAISGDVFNSPHKHIAFALRITGRKSSSIVEQVDSKFDTGFSSTTDNELGTVVSESKGDMNFHGLVCHGGSGVWWEKAPQSITKALDAIESDDDDIIAVVLMGYGLMSLMSGVDIKKNIEAIHKSKKPCVVYALNSDVKEVVFEIIE